MKVTPIHVSGTDIVEDSMVLSTMHRPSISLSLDTLARYCDLQLPREMRVRMQVMDSELGQSIQRVVGTGGWQL